MARRSRPSKLIRSAVTLAVQGSRPITASMATDLPEPEFADDGQHFARIERQRDAVDGAEAAMARGEVDGEIFDVEKRHRGLFVHGWRHYIALEPRTFTANSGGMRVKMAGPIVPIA